MKFANRMYITAVAFTLLAMPVCLAAQANQQRDHHRRYKLVDLGTFGGPQSYFIFNGARSLSRGGVATGGSDTSVADPYPICLTDCFISHTFEWRHGVVSDLGALPGVNVSLPNDINGRGEIVGISENGSVDLLTGFPEFDALLWQHGQITNLGTFGGNFSYANAINDRDQVTGFALNRTSDPFPLAAFCQNFPMGTQLHAFIWQEGTLQDLGTLGGPDSCALWINERGQAAGHSYTNSTINPETGFPTQDPFLWDGEKMIDLGTLGGVLGAAFALNNHGQVAGVSSLAQNPGACTDPPGPGCHPFLWDGEKLVDLGTLGGDSGQANWLNDRGEVVGQADLPNSQTHHAFLWKHGSMTDLGSQNGDPCSVAVRINSRGQIVGGSSDCSTFSHAFLWEDGGPMIDLNAFVPHGADLTLVQARDINDRGEIAVQAVLLSGDFHSVLLIPCDDEHPGERGCHGKVEAITQTSSAVHNAPTRMLPLSRMREGCRHHN